jgi:hypothetical protein
VHARAARAGRHRACHEGSRCRGREPSYRGREPCPGAREAAPWGPRATHRVAEATRAGGSGAAPPGVEGRAGMRMGDQGHARGWGKGRERERERERERREGSSPWDPKTGDNHPPDHLGQRGGRERWKKGRGSCCAGKTNEREGEGGAWGGGVPGSRGGAPGRAGLGRRSG